MEFEETIPPFKTRLLTSSRMSASRSRTWTTGGEDDAQYITFIG